MTMLARTRSIPESLGPRGARSRVIGLTGGGDGSTLDVDFTTGALPSGWSFARTGNGTVRGPTGLLSTVGTDVPRFDYDQATNLCRGLYMEGKRTNYLCGSQTFAAAGGTNQWVDSADFLRYTANNTAPDGTATALEASCDVANATCINNLSRTPSANAGCGTFSIWLRRVSGNGSIQLTDNNGTNWTTVTLTSTWTRFQLPHRTTAQQCGVRIVTGGDAIQMWGAQLEDGSGASSYIPTTTVAVSRNQDTLSLLGLTGFTPGAFTVLFDYLPVNEQAAGVVGGSSFPGVVNIASGSTSGSRVILLPVWQSLANPRILMVVRNGSGTDIGGFAIVNRTILSSTRAAFSVSGSSTVNRICSVNGATGTGASDGTGPVGSVDRIYVNNYAAIGNQDDYPCFLLRRLKVWPRAMSQAELNVLTA